jgi:hypothetical protein
MQIGLDAAGELSLATKVNWRPQPIQAPSLTRVFRGEEAVLELA